MIIVRVKNLKKVVSDAKGWLGDVAFFFAPDKVSTMAEEEIAKQIGEALKAKNVEADVRVVADPVNVPAAKGEDPKLARASVIMPPEEGVGAGTILAIVGGITLGAVLLAKRK
jgi:hypothetical protein